MYAIKDNEEPEIVASTEELAVEVVEKNSEIEDNSDLLFNTIEKVVKLPGVRVNRTTFLMEIFGASAVEVESKNFFDNISVEEMDKAASAIITKNVTLSSTAAFTLGLPGGFTMVASVPADIMQNFAFSLRLAQQLAYAYGFEDLFVKNELSTESVQMLVTFLGIMFMVTASGTVLRAISPNVGKYVGNQIITKPLTKTVWYPMLKNITKVVTGKTLTKSGVQGFATKAIPVIGGVASAGINVATMVPMANRLKNELRLYHLPENEVIDILIEDRKTVGDKASDLISSAVAGTVNAVNETKKLGTKFEGFFKDIDAKTKKKLNKE